MYSKGQKLAYLVYPSHNTLKGQKPKHERIKAVSPILLIDYSIDSNKEEVCMKSSGGSAVKDIDFPE